MRELTIILLFICSAAFSQTTYHVNYATGADSNSGTSGSPWKTRVKAYTEANTPGDTVYFHDDAVYVDSAHGPIHSGTRANPICFFAYPGDTPIFDFSTVRPGEGEYNRGFKHWRQDFIHYRGLTARNILQPDGQGGSFYEDGSNTIGWAIYGSTGVIVENCVADHVSGIGFFNVPEIASDTVWFINCDASNIIDTLSYHPTQNIVAGRGTGFRESHDYNTWGDTEGVTYFKGCRAWNCSDQGFSTSLDGFGSSDSCWSFENGYEPAPLGQGWGWKLGWQRVSEPSLRKVVTRCIAALNRSGGWAFNGASSYPVSWKNLYNNLAFKNDYEGSYKAGFIIANSSDTDANEQGRVVRNNISFDHNAVTTDPWIESGALYTHSNNTWDGGGTVTAADFAGPLDSASVSNALHASRKADGSLPDLDNFKLAEGSDLIDAGVDVGLPYNDDAPDLGPFESYPPLPPPSTGYKLTGGDGKILTDGNGKILIGR